MTNLPVGIVLFFRGTWVNNSTMVGWYKCDGNNGTHNFLNRFLRGGATSGTLAGSDDAITVSHDHTVQTKSHTHGGTTGSGMSAHTHTHSPWVYQAGGGWGTGQNLEIHGYSASSLIPEGHNHSGTISSTGSHSHTIDDAGSSGVGKNMPVYKSAIPIMRVS